MESLDSKIKQAPTIEDLFFFLKYYYAPALSKRNYKIENRFFKDVDEIVKYMNKIYFKNENWNSPSINTPLPDEIALYYTRIMNYLRFLN